MSFISIPKKLQKLSFRALSISIHEVTSVYTFSRATEMRREHWSSRVGFILATAGAAIGLGNIQRFPYIAAKHGGGAFLLVYLLCVICIGFPLILLEFAIGRRGKRNPMDAIAAIHSKGIWKYVGLLGVLTAYFILTYYLVAAGWTVGYIFETIQGHEITLTEFTSNPLRVLFCSFIFILLVILVIQEGLKKGVERASKILMPILFFLLVAIVIRSLTLPGSFEGLRYYLRPDFSQITKTVFLYALSQAFFSLCIGEGVLITFGSYTSPKENLVSAGYSIAFFDTVVAFLSGLIIFPALAAFSLPMNQGVGLIFQVMPKIFAKMPFGRLTGTAFFLILSFAAFTTCLALLETPVNFLMEKTKWSRKKTTWFLGLLAFVLSIPSALATGGSDWLTHLRLPFLQEEGWYEIMDFIWGGLAMVLGGFLLSLFTGWVWGTKNAVQELREGCDHFTWQGRLWGWIVKYIAPLVIFLIFLSLLKKN